MACVFSIIWLACLEFIEKCFMVGRVVIYVIGLCCVIYMFICVFVCILVVICKVFICKCNMFLFVKFFNVWISVSDIDFINIFVNRL